MFSSTAGLETDGDYDLATTRSVILANNWDLCMILCSMTGFSKTDSLRKPALLLKMAARANTKRGVRDLHACELNIPPSTASRRRGELSNEGLTGRTGTVIVRGIARSCSANPTGKKKTYSRGEQLYVLAGGEKLRVTGPMAGRARGRRGYGLARRPVTVEFRGGNQVSFHP